MEDKIVNRDGICKVEDDKKTIKLEQWDNEPTDTFSIDGNKLTMNKTAAWAFVAHTTNNNKTGVCPMINPLKSAGALLALFA
ncbi:MAG: hypothetical protein ACLUO4_06465 [Christensenellales bacterium]|jgi:hypothetical protein